MQQNPQNYFQSVYWPQNVENEIKQLKNRLMHYPLDEIIEYLNYDNIESKTAAIRILGETKSIEALPELVKLFHSTENNLIKKEIIGALGKIREPLAINHLIKNFESYPYRLKIATIKALAHIGTKHSVDFFVNQLDKNDPYVKTALINALAVIGDKSCINSLRNHLNDPDESVYEAINQALCLLETGERLSIGKIKELSQDLASIVSMEYDNPYISSIGMGKQKETESPPKGKIPDKQKEKDKVTFDNVLLNQTRPRIESTYDQYNPGYHSQFVEKPKKQDDEDLQIFETVSEISIENKMNKITLDEPLLNESFQKEFYGSGQDTIEDEVTDAKEYEFSVDSQEDESEDISFYDVKQGSTSEVLLSYSETSEAIYEDEEGISDIDLDNQFEQIEKIASEQESLIEAVKEGDFLDDITIEIDQSVTIADNLTDSLDTLDFPDNLEDLIEDQEIPEETSQSELNDDKLDDSVDSLDFPDEIDLIEEQEIPEEVSQDELNGESLEESLETIEFPDEIDIVDEHETTKEFYQEEISEEIVTESMENIDSQKDILEEKENYEEVLITDLNEEEPEPQTSEDEPEVELIELERDPQNFLENEKDYIEMLSNGIMRDKRQAIKELSRSKSDEAFQLLVNIAYNDISLIRKDAIKSLANLSNPEKYKYLMELLEDDKWYIREEAARALGNLAYSDAYDPMQKLLNDENKWVKETAIKALATINLQKTVEQVKCYLDSPDLNVKLAAESVLKVHEKNK